MFSLSYTLEWLKTHIFIAKPARGKYYSEGKY